MSFTPPPYPYERLDHVRAVAGRHDGGPIDCSIGTPCDPPPGVALDALARATGARGYPSSVGSPELRDACAGWLQRRFGVDVDPSHVAACVGTKEFVASLPGYLRLRDPTRDTVLFPAVSYPTYAMGATLAGCRAVSYRALEDVSAADAARAL
ncbi:MAG: aminotransferase class I/II-fold pyridoxal phosphate-dependent enzyme, partial [Acidimicrobiales bacterium]